MYKTYLKLNFFFVVVVLATIVMVSCGNNENTHQGLNRVDPIEYIYENSIYSIVQNTDEDIRFDEVYSYLTTYLDFINKSDSIGYHRYTSDDCDRGVLWKDCGDIRIYSIPCPSMYSYYCRNIVQFKETGRIDTSFLNDNAGEMERLYRIKNKSGKDFYILKTRLDVQHQGTIAWEYISAFSIEKGQLVKEKLFHTRSMQYDMIEVECGGQRYIPLDFEDIVLIGMDYFEWGESTPTFVIAEINENDWPTGYGLKYLWNGNYFEYVGKCHYEADDIIYD